MLKNADCRNALAAFCTPVPPTILSQCVAAKSFISFKLNFCPCFDPLENRAKEEKLQEVDGWHVWALLSLHAGEEISGTLKRPSVEWTS